MNEQETSMKNRQGKRISRRVLRHFLQLAAASFALGASVAPASTDNDESRTPAEQVEDSAPADVAGVAVRRGAWQHTFALPAPAAAGPAAHGVRAHVRVLDATGRNRAQLALHGAGTVGPFADGAYTVLLKSGGLTEVHRIRIGSGTEPYLQFTEAT
jgi:hypothetical protein